MAKKETVRTYSVGWLFWLITMGIFAGPAIYVCFKIVVEGTFFMVPVGFGLIAAALAAGILSWAVNAVLQFRNRRARLKARKAARKK